MSYAEFLASKEDFSPPAGIAHEIAVTPALFPFQAAIVRWALRRGRAAVFADCGMGKTLIELEWARHVAAHTGRRVLILTPLAVAGQMVREARAFGIGAVYLREPAETTERIVITNYERLGKFDASEFAGVALDESSILKAFDGRTRTFLIKTFAETPFRLAATATPAPNDYVELGNHSEFLGIKPRVEMLAEYFVHDGSDTQTWRLKRHAQDVFWRWVASWAVAARRPSDLGFDDAGYDLPPLSIHEHIVASDIADGRAAGMLFALPARGLDEQRVARRASLRRRVAKAAEVVAREPGEPWLVWCDLNEEGDSLTALIPGAVQVKGADSAEHKEQSLLDFADGRIGTLVSKSSIAGFGMNFQICARMLFVGVTHSFEQFFQAVRRCHRFGQKRPVEVHVICGDLETEVLASLRRKERDVGQMLASMVGAMAGWQQVGARGAVRESNEYRAAEWPMPGWLG